MIRVPRIRVIGPDGDQLGVMTPERGMLIAEDRKLDLVEVAPEASPPVCRVMDYGRFRYEQSKKKQANKQRTAQLKEIRLRPKTDDHDLEFKLRKARKMLDRGDRVRLVMRLRGRERGVVSRWTAKLRDLVAEMGDDVRTQGPPQHEGRAVSVTLEPIAESG